MGEPIPTTLSPDRAVPAATIETRPLANGNFTRVCGTCGVVIASGHVDVHIAWHAAAWGSPVVTAPTLNPAQK